MMNKFSLEILSPSTLFYSGEVESVNIPLRDGYMQVLANHSTGLGILGNGVITIFDGEKYIKVNCNNGVVKIDKNKTQILGNNFKNA